MHNIKVMVIGLDGATWDVIMPLVDRGELPTFKHFIENGSWGVLKSTIPPITIPAWPSFVTGKNPGKFGIFDFLMPDKNLPKGRIVMSRDIKSKKIWDYLGYFDIKSIIINLPNSYPPEKINGVMVSGMLTPPDSNFTYPEGIIKNFDYEIEIDPKLILKYRGSRKLLDILLRIINKRLRLAEHFLDNFEWDLFFILIRETDIIQHVSFKEFEKVGEIYKYIDKKLFDMLSCIDINKTIVVLMSDHGFSPLNKTFYVNNWLHKLGLLHMKKIEDVKNVNKINKMLLKLGFTQDRLIKIIKKFRLLSLVAKIIPPSLISKIPSTAYEIDFNNSIAYSGGHFGSEATYILLNKNKLKDKQEYEKVRNLIIKELLKLTDPNTGEHIVEKVYKGEKLFTGEFSSIAPDIVMLLKRDCGMSAVVTGDQKILQYIPTPSGTHDINGIVLFYGPGIKKGYKIEGAKIYDITPTILHIFGLPIPNDMDGRILMEIFEKDSESAKRKPKYVNPSYYEKKEKREKERIKQAIKNLKLKDKI